MPADADLRQSVLNLFEFEWLDDRGDEFHAMVPGRRLAESAVKPRPWRV